MSTLKFFVFSAVKVESRMIYMFQKLTFAWFFCRRTWNRKVYVWNSCMPIIRNTLIMLAHDISRVFVSPCTVYVQKSESCTYNPKIALLLFLTSRIHIQFPATLNEKPFRMSLISIHPVSTACTLNTLHTSRARFLPTTLSRKTIPRPFFIPDSDNSTESLHHP